MTPPRLRDVPAAPDARQRHLEAEADVALAAVRLAVDVRHQHPGAASDLLRQLATTEFERRFKAMCK